MKKVIGILCVMGLLLGVVSGVMAEDKDAWAILMRGSSTEYQDAAGFIQCGTAATPSSTWYTGNTGGQAQVVIYKADGIDTPPYYKVDKQSYLSTADSVKSWTLLFWVGTAYVSDTARLSWWATSTTTPLAEYSWSGVPYQYTITVDRDPTGTYVAGTTWTFTPGATGSPTTPVGYADFENAYLLKMADANAVNSGVKLTLTAAPVPEPGSMLALGSGLVGLVGFAFRRRR